MNVAKRRGRQKAIVALARRLAVIMHRIRWPLMVRSAAFRRCASSFEPPSKAASTRERRSKESDLGMKAGLLRQPSS
jgi:hypothetical protein